jgi:phage baseplate assembly protein W
VSVERGDYAHPFAIGPSGQASQARYEAHVRQLVRQVLLTSPGERIDLPEFGCGLRRLVFAPHDPNLDATTSMLVQQSLRRWLGDQIVVQQVRVVPLDETGDDAQLVLEVSYLLRETQSTATTQVRVL